MRLFDAIKEMRRLSKDNIPFSFSFMSYNSSKDSSEGVVFVRQGRLRARESTKFNSQAEGMESYIDLERMEVRQFHQPLLMTFNGEKVTV